MKYLKEFKFFEKLGVINDLEDQVVGYMDEIKSNPDKKSFRFIYNMKTKQGNTSIPFTLIFKKDMDGEGVMQTDEDYHPVRFSITLKNRNDFSTLLHEVKHIDYFNRVEDCYKDLYFKASNEVENFKDLKLFRSVFYAFTENEFQSQYLSYYKDFDQFCSKLNNPTTNDIVNSFNTFLKEHPNQIWTWYFANNDIKFTNYKVDPNLVKILFKKVIIPIMNKEKIEEEVDMTFYSISHMLKSYWEKIKNFFIHKKIEFTDKEEKEISNAMNIVERNINKKRVKYNKRMKRIIPLMIEKYVK